MPSLSQKKTKSSAGDHDRDDLACKVQTQGVCGTLNGEYRYLSEYPATYSEGGGLQPPSPMPLGALQPLQPETESHLQFCGLQTQK